LALKQCAEQPLVVGCFLCGWNQIGGGIYTSYTVPKPSLCLATANNNLAFSWTMPSTNFVLQKISNLSKANWTTLTNTPLLNLTNLQNQIILPSPGSNVFYRLKTP
jgi:hypothetical protein